MILNRVVEKDCIKQSGDRLVKDALRNTSTTRPVVFEAMTMSILPFQQKKIDKLEQELNSLRKLETRA